MKKHKFFAVLTAAVVAISSALVFPSAAFAEEEEKGTYTITPDWSETVTLDSEGNQGVEYWFDWGAERADIAEESGLDEDTLLGARVAKISITYSIECTADDFKLVASFDGSKSNGDEVRVGTPDDENEPVEFIKRASGTISTAEDEFSEYGVASWNHFHIRATGRGTEELTLNVAKVEVEYYYRTGEPDPIPAGTYDLTENVMWLVGARTVNQDSSDRYHCGADQWVDPNDETPWQLEGINTLGDFFSRYDTLEMRFRVQDIDGGLKAVGAITTKNGKTITLPAQNVTEGNNIYRASLTGLDYTASDPFGAVSVSLCSTTSSITSFVFLEYDTELLTATGTKTFKNEYKPASSVTAYVNNEGMRPDAAVDLWGGSSGVALPANTLTELYSEYKGGEITYYVSGLASNVDIKANILIEYDGDEWPNSATVFSNHTVKNGKNTINFNLTPVNYPEGSNNIHSIWLQFHAEPEYVTSFELINSTSSNTDEIFYKENEVSESVESSPDAAGVPAGDKITSITINPAFNLKNKDGDNVELDLSKIKIKAKEIYDEESLERVEEALGKEIAGNKHYNLLDLTLLYNGEDFSNGYEGLVQVIIPLPTGHRDKTFSCYRMTEVNGKMVKEEIPGKQTEDSYIIYLEHFSLYALVADANPDDGEKKPGGSKTPAASASVTSDDTSTSVPNTNNPGTGTAGVGVFAALAAVSAAAAIICRKKKHD